MECTCENSMGEMIMKTLAIVDCGNLTCRGCMWLENHWCELFDAYPEQFEEDFKPLDVCMKGREEATKFHLEDMRKLVFEKS